jgi:hypothetical protein
MYPTPLADEKREYRSRKREEDEGSQEEKAGSEP